MTEPNRSGLFRSEAVEAQRGRLDGAISLATPVRWQLVAAALFSVLVTGIFLLLNGSYARVETVTGSVVLDKGVATVAASRPGIVEAVFVEEGQVVSLGTRLASLRTEERLAGSLSAPQRVQGALQEQDAQLGAQAASLREAASAEQRRIRAQISGTGEEIGRLEAQIGEQRRLITKSEANLARFKVVAERGFVSGRELDAQEATLVSRRQYLSQLEQQADSKRSDAIAAERSVAGVAAAASGQIAAVESTRVALQEQFAEAELSRGYTLEAPLDGTVTGATARVGQRVEAAQSLMSVVPRNASQGVELYVPTNAIGFIRKGQTVRIAVDAYPYQRFGTIRGSIAHIAGVASSRVGSKDGAPVYLVTVHLYPNKSVAAKRLRLLPGMTLSARIVTDRRRLVEWLFQPLFSVLNR